MEEIALLTVKDIRKHGYSCISYCTNNSYIEYVIYHEGYYVAVIMFCKEYIRIIRSTDKIYVNNFNYITYTSNQLCEFIDQLKEMVYE